VDQVEEWKGDLVRVDNIIDRMKPILERHTVMLAISRGSVVTAGDVAANGTGSLIDTGTVKALVTNHHVYSYFKERHVEDVRAMLMMSGADDINFLDISEARVLALDEGRDLAVLSVPPDLVARQGKAFFACEVWPPPRPEPGLLVFCFGYPGQGRVPDGFVLGVHANLISLGVERVRADNFVIADIRGDAQHKTPEGREPLTSFGGMSGSAVYGFWKEDVALQLAGFLYGAHGMSLRYATHADHLKADGTIRERTGVV
jgi:Trypsin-like peptidase domain